LQYTPTRNMYWLILGLCNDFFKCMS
jgi:hypothetical protein